MLADDYFFETLRQPRVLRSQEAPLVAIPLKLRRLKQCSYNI